MGLTKLGRFVICALLLAGLLMSAASAPAAAAAWTVLVYADGDNDLESAAIEDVNQMELAPASDQVNVLVQLDRSPSPFSDTSNGNWSGARRYKIAPDSDPSVIQSSLLADLGNTDMGDPTVLVDFVEWGIHAYPADHYALILWDHGSGWRALSETPPAKAICFDDTSNDYLTLAEVKTALASVRTALGRGLDVLACDACIMGEVEIAYALRSSVDYYVASEENVPNAGFPYNDLLARLEATPTMGAGDFCRDLVSTYRTSYSGGDQGRLSVTLSAVDLSFMGDLAAALSGFANALQDTAAAVPTYGANLHTWWELAQISQYADRWQVDLPYFAELVQADAPTPALGVAAGNLLAVLDSALIANGITGYPAVARQGLSVYYPFAQTYNSSYSALDLAVDTTWDEFLRSSPTSTDYVPDRFEPDDTLAQAGPIPLCQSQGRRWFHVKGDVDMGTFPAEAGKQYFVVTENLGPKCDTNLSLLAADGTVLASSDPDGQGPSHLLWTCPTSAAYAVSVTQSSSPFTADNVGSSTAYDLYLSPVTFPDVVPDQWAFRPIESCAQAGIVSGYADGYHPAEPVDRAQMAGYIARVLCGGAPVPDPPPGTQSFGDVGPDFWAYAYIEYCKSATIVGGYGDGYRPATVVDRGQMAMFIARALVPISERPDLTRYTPPAAPSFPDVPPGFWAYKAVEYCAARGIVSGYWDGYHPEYTVTRDQMAAYVARGFGL